MLSHLKRVLNGDPLNATERLISEQTLTNPPLLMTQGCLWMPNSQSPPQSTRELSQQLINDLAELREGSVVVYDDAAGFGARRMQPPICRPGATLPWLSFGTPEPPRPHFTHVHSREDSISSSSWSTLLDAREEFRKLHSRLSELKRNSPYQGHPPAPLDVDVITERRLLNWEPQYYHHPSKYIHVAGEDVPFKFDPFADDVDYQWEDGVRSIDTDNGKIFSPVPRTPMATALANFEAIALAATMPPAPTEDDTKPVVQASTMAKGWSVFMEDGEKDTRGRPQASTQSEVLYETGPGRINFLSDMTALLSMRSGPLKEEKMRELWGLNSSGASSSGPGLQEMTGDEVYDALVPVPRQPLSSYPGQ